MYRILYISYHINPLVNPGCRTSGGMNIVLNYLSRYLTDLGHDVCIITSHELEKTKVVHVNGYRIVCIPKTDFRNHLKEFVDDFKPQIIHLHYWKSGKYSDPLFGKYPIVVSFHTLGIPKKLLGFSVEGERIRIEQYLVDLSDAVITSSSCERNDLIEHYNAEPVRVTTINLGVDSRVFRPIPKDLAKRFVGLNDRFILYAGRLVQDKGLHLLLHAMKRLPLEIKLLIVGGTQEEIQDFKNKYPKLVEGDSRIVFKGIVEHSYMPFYYSSAECVVIPSLYESFGLVALESMACGVPVVASNTGGLSVLVKNNFNGYLFERGNVDSLAQRLHDFLEDKSNALLMRERAFRSTKKYNWNDTVRKYLQVYSAIIRGGVVSTLREEPCMESLSGISL